MQPHREICPACNREFRSILDYPTVRIRAFEQLPVPEAVDTMSGAAAEKRLARRRRENSDADRWLEDGINLTPEIARACGTAKVREYLARLESLVGQEVEPRELQPPFKPRAMFKWAHPIPKSSLYLSLGDPDEQPTEERTAEIEVHSDGPNLGSAGGPTLQLLGAIARLKYEGLLSAAYRRR